MTDEIAKAKAVKAAKAAAWYVANRDKQLAYVKAWMAANPDRVRANRRAAYYANPEKARAEARAWGAAHPERKKAAYDAWLAANPERRQALTRKGHVNRRARKKAAFVENVDPAVVFERDGGICRICDLPIGDAKWHIDHKYPIARGGEHSYRNVQLAHATCNLRKASKVIDFHEVSVDGLVVEAVGDVCCYDASVPVSVGVDSMSILSGPLSWLKTTRLTVDPLQDSLQVAIGTDAGGVMIGIFRSEDRWYANVAIDGIGGQQVHLAELGGRRNTPIVSVPNRGYVFDSSWFFDDPNGDATLRQEYTVMISDAGAWHRTTWTHLAEAVAWLCRDLGLVVARSEI